MSSQANTSEPSGIQGDHTTTGSPASDDTRVSLRDLGSLFAKRPLIFGEEDSEYDDLLSKVTAGVKPADVIEAMWVQDLVDLTWEMHRLRRLKAGLLKVAATPILVRAVTSAKNHDNGPPYDREFAESIVSDALYGCEDALGIVDEILKGDKADLSPIMAEALANRLDDIERFERLIASADARRSRIVADLERHRGGLARRLRAAPELTDVTWSETLS